MGHQSETKVSSSKLRVRDSNRGLRVRHVLLVDAGCSFSWHLSKRVGRERFFFRGHLGSYWFGAGIIGLVLVPAVVVASELGSLGEGEFWVRILHGVVQIIYDVRIGSNLRRRWDLWNQIRLAALLSSVAECVFWHSGNFVPLRGVIDVPWSLLRLFRVLWESGIQSNSHGGLLGLSCGICLEGIKVYVWPQVVVKFSSRLQGVSDTFSNFTVGLIFIVDFLIGIDLI